MLGDCFCIWDVIENILWKAHFFFSGNYYIQPISYDKWIEKVHLVETVWLYVLKTESELWSRWRYFVLQ